MRKNLFLTLAFAFAALVGVNAQNWSKTLTTDDELPGVKTEIEHQERYVFKSEVITPDAPLQTLRLTFGETEGNNALNGFPFVGIAELVVYGADGTTPISYTATSNADQNTMGGSEDGAGLAGLNDGIYTNYWHSCWQGSVAEYHYLELTFSEPVSEFVLEWATRGGNYFHNAPTMVGLTAGGVEFVPFADWNFAVGNQLTTMDALLNAKYFALKSNVPVEYHTYVNNHESTDGAFGTQITKEPNEGPGPKFVKDNVGADEATPDYAIQLIPTDGGYYFYFVKEGKFLSKHQSHNGWNGANGTQASRTAVISNAAVVNITQVENGRFELDYWMEYNGEPLHIYIGATPSTGAFKIFDEERYNFYKLGNPYCLNYAYVVNFDWSLYEVNMDFPTRYYSTPVKGAVKEAEGIYTYMDSVAVEGYEGYFTDFVATLDAAKKGLEEKKYTNADVVFEDVAALNAAMGLYVYTKIAWYHDDFLPLFVKQYRTKLTPQSNPKDGYYITEIWDLNIQQNLVAAGDALYNAAYDDPYAYINDMKSYIDGAQGNIDAFLASKVEYVTLPKVYSSDDIVNTPLGTHVAGAGAGHNDWEQLVVLGDGTSVNGIRLTFLGTNKGGSSNNGLQNNYPMLALSGLEIRDGAGNRLALSTDLVTSNSEVGEEREGAGNGIIAALFDDDLNTYYHSDWGGGRYEQPYTYIYFDIKFPEGVSLNTFTVKTIGRQGQAQVSLAPSSVCITNYGEAYDPLVFRENPYNVAGGTQITDESQLKDGGIYILSGNLRVKTQEATPRYYAGIEPYHTNIKAALNDPCVYMFKKTADGWNIISLANAQFWALNKEVTETTDEETQEVTVSKDWSTGLTVYPENAANIKIKKSGNLENTFVLYSEIEDNNVGASWTWVNENDTTDVVEIEEGLVNANKFVFMDWDGSLAGRPCVSELPGEFTYGLEKIEAHAKAQDFKDGDGYSAGDYLHFNKSNGEGEWNIYEVTMPAPYYLWANAIPATLNSLGLAVGKDPGCILGDIADLEAAVEDVESVIATENAEGAQAAVEAFVASIGLATDVERVKVEDQYWYALESAYPEYYRLQGEKKGIYATTSGLSWTAAPAVYDRANDEFVFQFLKYDGVADLDGYGVPEAKADCVYKIYSDVAQGYLGTGGGSTQVAIVESDIAAALYVVEPLEANIYTLYALGHQPLHTAGHGDGTGSQGSIVEWEGAAGSCSSWYIRFVDDAEGTSISDLVVEGDEVVSVAYFTPSGAAVPAPVNGVNIVVTVYSNGVVETKKVLVK